LVGFEEADEPVVTP